MIRRIILAIILISLLTSCSPREISINDLNIVDDIAYALNEDKPFTGNATSYYEDGKMYAIYPIVEGLRQGKVKIYYQDGTLKEETDYVNGKKNGFMKSYHPNGKIQDEEKYKEGIMYGVWKKWDREGNLLKEGTME